MLTNHYRSLGDIAEVVNKKNGEIVSYPREKIWTGNISASKNASPQFKTELTSSLSAGMLDEYFVPASLDALTRCIDGREIEGYAADPQLRNRPLGPQVPGGTAIAALAHRIVNVGNLSAKVTFEDDIDDVIKLFTVRGKSIGFGGHVDTNSNPNGNTGCGAIDNVPAILQRTAGPKSHRQLRGLTARLLGESYDDATVDLIIGRIVNLQSLAQTYFLVNEKTGIYRYKQRVISEMRKRSRDFDHIDRLVGSHHEAGLVINMVPNTTFDRDRFSADHHHTLQLFNYDLWHTHRGAGLLYPVDNIMDYKTAKRNLRLQHDYITCRVLLAVATIMVLTDGTVKLIVRSPTSL